MKNHEIGSTTAGAGTSIDARVQRNVVQINLHFFVPCLDVFFPLENLKVEIWLVRDGSSPDLYKNGATWPDFVFITSSLTSRGDLPLGFFLPTTRSSLRHWFLKMILLSFVTLSLAFSAPVALAGSVQLSGLQVPQSAATDKAAVVDIFTRSYQAYRYFLLPF